LTNRNIVEFLADIFIRRGSEEYLGESVTMEQHMLQAAHFAELAGEEEVVIVAALLHDIGHFTSEFGSYSPDDTEDRYHEEAGAQVLDGLFPPLVLDCIRYHVAAKRYLCAVNADYFDRLSSASVHTLSLQGGPMTSQEVCKFEENVNLSSILKVRYYDDAGKQQSLQTRPFSYYAPMVKRIADSHKELNPGVE